MTEANAVPVRPADQPAMRLASAARADEFTALYETAFRDVSGYCAALLRDDQLARDLTQEAFTRLFSRWRSVKDPRAYVFIIATNLVREEWKRRTRHTTLLDAVRPLVRAETAQPDGALLDVVTRLPRRLRDVVVLHLVVDLPVAEVALVAGIPVGTVKRRLHEARARLRTDWLEER